MAAAAMEDLAERYADRAVRSVFVYTREAHPGENYPHHTSMADKRDRARAFKEHCKVRRPILLDDLEGACHRAYGTLPNMTWIMGRGGLILYKGAWTGVEDIEDALATGLDAHARRAKDQLVGFYSERLAWRVNDLAGFHAGLERAGPQAVADFYGKSGKDAAD
jgi:hypothetical protein